MYFYSWADPANLRDRQVRARENSGMCVMEFIYWSIKSINFATKHIVNPYIYRCNCYLIDCNNNTTLIYAAPAPDIITTMIFKSFIGRSSPNNVARMMKNDTISLGQVIKRNYK